MNTRSGERDPKAAAKIQTACIHVPPFAERVERDKEGKLRVYCSKCGRFIGYRSESVLKDSKS